MDVVYAYNLDCVFIYSCASKEHLMPCWYFVYFARTCMVYIFITVRGKAMHILRYRCDFEVQEFTRTKFREFNPPLYSCVRCHQTFLFKSHKLFHIHRCTVSIQDPSYISWSLSRPLVDAAVTPLLTRFYQREKLVNSPSKRDIIDNNGWITMLVGCASSASVEDIVVLILIRMMEIVNLFLMLTRV